MIPFDMQDLHARLDAMSPEQLDEIPFGVIQMDERYRILHYNASEARFAGLTQSRLVGRQFFVEVAPCMNNFMVAQRMVDEPELDAIIDYVLTFRMRPTPVTLRLLQSTKSAFRYAIILKR